jgi:flagellar biosynthesis regulator FlaF
MAASAEEESTRAALKFMAQVWLRLAQEKETAENVLIVEID